jgi:putative phosphoribosyl transferase
MSQAVARQVAKARDVQIRSGAVALAGDLELPAQAKGVVLFAHGSGGSRYSSRNQFVARMIREAGLGILLFDLLTREEATDTHTRLLRFDIPLLAERLIDATCWLKGEFDICASLISVRAQGLPRHSLQPVSDPSI